MIKLHNTLTGKVEEFKPIKAGHVSMYNCGPTVYDHAHIGNLRAFFLADILRRNFEIHGMEVKQVMNITDVGQLSGDGDSGEDKMTKGLKREGKPITMDAMRELASFYTDRFKEDIGSLNILTPHVLPKASEHIEEDIEIIRQLEKKGFTYNTSDGVYFDTSKDQNYGKLGGINKNENEGQARVEANTEKKNQKDFALWKFNKDMGYPSDLGHGFPGWHIECSAMSKAYLGEHFDIHTGGIDLAPIHHNNEIAQSENACGCQMANFWIHNEFVNITGEKMAKSLGNHITIKTLVEKGFSPVAYRYFLLLSHYRTPTNFSWEALEAAENAYKRLKIFFGFVAQQANNDMEGEVNEKYKTEFLEAIENDLNTPEALAIVWKLSKLAGDEVSYKDTLATLLYFDKFLGLNLEQNEYEIKELSDDIQKLLNERAVARETRDWAKADELRQEIESKGYKIKDSDAGQSVERA